MCLMSHHVNYVIISNAFIIYQNVTEDSSLKSGTFRKILNFRMVVWNNFYILILGGETANSSRQKLKKKQITPPLEGSLLLSWGDKNTQDAHHEDPQTQNLNYRISC